MYVKTPTTYIIYVCRYSDYMNGHVVNYTLALKPVQFDIIMLHSLKLILPELFRGLGQHWISRFEIRIVKNCHDKGDDSKICGHNFRFLYRKIEIKWVGKKKLLISLIEKLHVFIFNILLIFLSLNTSRMLFYKCSVNSRFCRWHV